jgi:arginyl-tRNA synthetase
MGYLDGEDNEGSGGLEMSGRKGIGVKADDLIDQLVDKSRQEISTRDRELPLEKLDRLAHEIAIAALRFFTIKATTNRVIAFDLNDALSFEGDSGPYLQYSAVRARNIQRRLLSAGMVAQVDADTVAQLSADLWADDLWDLVLSVALIPQKIDMAGATLELSILARHALELAQKFHAVYHRHPIMQEENESLRHTRLAATMIFLTGLEAMSQLLGIPLPDRM